MSSVSVRTREPIARARVKGPARPVPERILSLLLALTALSVSFQVGGVPFGVGDLLLLPFLLIMGSELIRWIRIPGLYAVAVYLYLSWAVVTLLWTENLFAAVATLVQYTQFMLVTVVVFSTVRSFDALLRCLNAYIIAASVLAVAVLLYAGATGTFAYVYFLNYQKNYLGAIVGNAVPLIVGLLMLGGAGQRKRLLRLALILNIAALIVSSSRGSWLGALAGVFVVLLLARRLSRVVALGGAAVILGWGYLTFVGTETLAVLTDFSEGSSAYSRILIFRDVWRFISENLFVGSGLRSYTISIPSIGFKQDDPNNLFLLNAAEVGLIGTSFFCLMLAAIARDARHNSVAPRIPIAHRTVSAALAGAITSHLVHIQLDVSWVRGTGTFVFACVGLVFALRRFNDEATKVALGSEHGRAVDTADSADARRTATARSRGRQPR